MVQNMNQGKRTTLFSLLKLAIPLALTGIAQSSVYFFETLFLAHLGKDVLAAGALVSWLLATIVVIFFGALSSINVLVALKHGANDQKGIASVMRDGLLMAVLFSIPIVFLCWYMAPIFLFFGQSAHVVVLAQAYLHALVWGIIPNFILLAMLELIVGIGHARTVMVFSMLSVILTLFFSFVLIFGKLGFPVFGIAGAGWGITIGNIVTFVVLSIYIICRNVYRKYFNLIFSYEKPSFLIELLQIGLPMGLMYSVEVGFFFTLTLIMGTLGIVFLAANQIAMQYLGFFMSIIFSIAQAITVRMGHLLGGKEFKLAQQSALMGIALSGTFMFLVAIVFWIFPSYLISFDFNIHESQNQELVVVTTQLLFISSLFQILESVRISLFGVLRALKDTHFTLITSIISFWVLSLPLGYLFATVLGMNAAGYWWGMIVGVITSIIILIFRYRVKIHRLAFRGSK